MINYPSGQQPPERAKAHPLAKTSAKPVNYGSRGMTLEEQINRSNQYYLSHNLAVIHKKPTPIQVVKVNYPKRSAARITEAYYRQASTTDYNGVYQGYYIDFEAKETRNKTRFPLSNLPLHQQQHMKQCQEQGGISFLLLSFRSHQKIYLLPFKAFERFQAESKQQSLPYEFVEANGYLCQTGYQPMIDYLAALDCYLERGER
ncbi:Holliday junction resolvase RecU [Suicoccus acidiformans]|uniref:Holliday junction resolvase RecU n=1 Tax=Suicoccus acidiformans TaxID=2036206 RepID=A0A347WL76_9LACT|nr:Holliday junction resolvase RecU [Suicoccus acidiformans]AXY25833.1 Holliday junction resolvase RecU [Suicoccus acidiformans]